MPTITRSLKLISFMTALLTHWNNKVQKEAITGVDYLMLFDCLFVFILVSGCP